MKHAGAHLPAATHRALRRLAAREGRTLPDQCRHLFRQALAGELVVPRAPSAPSTPSAFSPPSPSPDSQETPPSDPTPVIPRIHLPP